MCSPLRPGRPQTERPGQRRQCSRTTPVALSDMVAVARARGSTPCPTARYGHTARMDQRHEYWILNGNVSELGDAGRACHG